MMNPTIPERWQEWIEERAALLEYEAGMARDAAERVALAMLRTYLTKLQQRRAA
jgi:hypothetical protein